jgi:hypothetical protein
VEALLYVEVAITRTQQRWNAIIVVMASALTLSSAVVACGSRAAPSDLAPSSTPTPGQARPTIQVTHSVAAPTVTVTPHCGNTIVGPALGPSPDLPANPLVTVAKAPGGIVALVVDAQGIFVQTPTRLIVSTLTGRTIRSIALPANIRTPPQITSSIVTDGDGNSYLTNYQSGVLDKLSPAGGVVWTRHPGHPTAMFAIGRGSTFRLAVSEAGVASSALFDADGQPQGTIPIVAATGSAASGTYVTEASDGDLLVAAAGRVEVMDPTGTRLMHEFGGQQFKGAGAHVGGPYQFYLQGQAAPAPDGVIYTADPQSDIEATTANGLLEGATNLDGKLQLANGYLFVVDGRAYVESGAIFTPNVQVSSIPLNVLDAYLSAPQASVDTLGWGAGLSTPVAGNYFPPGTRPTVDADFAPWWAGAVSRFQLRYSVWDADQLAVVAPPVHTVALPTGPGALAHVALPIPLADVAPGPYEVEADLYQTGSTPPILVGTTCLPLTVGAMDDRLDLATLPPGSGAGGPADPRGVALDAQLGLNGLRGALIDWNTFLPSCQPSDPSERACGPTALDFAHAPVAYFQAAAVADRDHISYWIQVTGGDPISLMLTQRGWWQADIRTLVSYYTHPPAACPNCAAVTDWEPWNEPNNTGWATGADYVAKVLRPFYQGVKAADPTATVIGGSTLEVPLDWWRSLIAAGGLAFLDVAAVHPYTGNNDAFEEDGILDDVEALQRLIRQVPLWFSEVGWWGDGDYNVVNQGNDMARAILWQRILHIPVWNYYYVEGSSPPGGVSFTLVKTADIGDDYVTGAALATMVVSNQTGDRPYESTVATGIPHTYAADFGPAPGGSSRLLAVWSDGLATTGVLQIGGPGGSTPVTMVDEYGGRASAALTADRPYALPISGQVTYIIYPMGDSVSVRAPIPYGTDLAVASGGAKASASSGDASAAITGSVTGPGWSSTPGDDIPALTVTLPRPASVDHVMLDTQSPGSTATGLRDYTVSVRRPGGDWVVVRNVVGQFAAHIEDVVISPQVVTAVKITVTRINYGGYASGGIPSFWPLDQTGVAFVHSFEIYGGTAPASDTAGSKLPPLP